MTRRTLLLCWLLTLVPLAALSVAALRLLAHEQERLARQEHAAAEELAASTAAALQLVVEDAETGLLRALQDLPAAGLPDALRQWEQKNPLVRTAFLWTPGLGLVLPDPASGETATLRFAARYAPLFEGQTPWSQPAPESKPAPDRSQTAVSQLRESSQQLQRWNQTTEPVPATASTPDRGWTTWFSGQDLCLLGWSRDAQGAIRGVELETLALLAQLIAVMPRTLPPGMTIALLDGEGRVLHKAGPAPVEVTAQPTVAVPLEPLLPHWRVGIQVEGRGAARSATLSFWLVAGLLLAAFAAAIVTSTVLLTREANRRQREALQKTSFVSNVSHELKTPLTTIRMYAELLEEGRVADPEKRAAYLQTIVRESQRLTRLVNNVLDFSRIEQNRKHYQVARFDLADTVTTVLDAYTPRLVGAGLTLVRRLPETPLNVHADRDAVEQALLNLLDNASKYAATGRDVEVALHREGNQALLDVLDRGPGIPRGQETRLFQPFHRGDDSLTAPHPGCGLGLSIARRQMRDLGGDLVYAPREGGGACFRIILPEDAPT